MARLALICDPRWPLGWPSFLEVAPRAPSGRGKALTAHDRFEVCGTLRCPCYALPAEANGGVSNKGFGVFVQQQFAGNAKQQLLRLVRERGLVAREAFEEAVAGEGLEYLLM